MNTIKRQKELEFMGWGGHKNNKILDHGIYAE
jgi:hypothetical protein